MPTFNMIHGDCLDAMKTLADCSVDSVVTDPPYGLKFMGKAWDCNVPSVDVWRECLRVLKPGGHLLAFAGTRTQHRMACAIEDAGFEIRDLIAWVYGSGFPKSLDVSKAIDKAAGAEREKIRVRPRPETSGTVAGSGELRPWIEKSREVGYHEVDGNTPVTDAAKQWQGWGTALKPAMEMITVARKPLIGTVANNVLEWGTGAINVDGCRVATDDPLGGGAYATKPTKRDQLWGDDAGNSWRRGGAGEFQQPPGRWPANIIHDGSDEVVGLFPETTSTVSKARNTGIFSRAEQSKQGYRPDGPEYANEAAYRGQNVGFNDSGSAARFFYCAKASKRDRDDGCEGLELRLPVDGADKWTEQDRRKGDGVNRLPSHNHHPTVKPTALMRYLVRLVTPPNGLVLDPFAGTGSTGRGAILEGMQFLGIEKDEAYVNIANKRIQVLLGDLFNADT